MIFINLGMRYLLRNSKWSKTLVFCFLTAYCYASDSLRQKRNHFTFEINNGFLLPKDNSHKFEHIPKHEHDTYFDFDITNQVARNCPKINLNYCRDLLKINNILGFRRGKLQLSFDLAWYKLYNNNKKIGYRFNYYTSREFYGIIEEQRAFQYLILCPGLKYSEHLRKSVLFSIGGGIARSRLWRYQSLRTEYSLITGQSVTIREDFDARKLLTLNTNRAIGHANKYDFFSISIKGSLEKELKRCAIGINFEYLLSEYSFLYKDYKLAYDASFLKNFNLWYLGVYYKL